MSDHITPRTRDIAQERYPWMNEAQIECLQFVFDIHLGSNHFFGKVRPSGDNGIVAESDTIQFATFDNSELTHAVIIAHDRAIRFSILFGTNGYRRKFAMAFHKRGRDGDCGQRHPTIEQQIVRFRGKGGAA